jgi:hypothetical protein
MRFDAVTQISVQGAPHRWKQQQRAERIGEEPGRQQERAGDHQAQGFEHLRDRQRSVGQLSLCPQQHADALVAQHPGADHRGQDDQRQRGAEPDPAADLDEQRDLDSGADQRGQG